MGELILCNQNMAAFPYYVEEAAIGVYSLEELSYYICHNVYLLRSDFMNEDLCNWLERELKLKDDADALREIVRKGGTLSEFVTCLLSQSGYCDRMQIAQIAQQIAELEEQLRQMEPAATENKELRQLLGLRQQRSDLVFEAARVTQRDVSNWASTLVLDRGSQHGVAIGDCAVDSAGNLVGVVTDVGLNWCRLSTVLDTDSQFGARVFRTGETAVAGGDLALMAEGRLRLQYLSDSANLIKGDVIVTSGLGGYYPAGLVIGTVESVQTDDGGLARYAVLSPKCDVAAIQEMFIITDFDVIQ